MRSKQMSVAALAALISLMLSAAVAGAITAITCTGTNPCEGTNGIDKIEDSDGDDVIYGYGGNDDINSWNGGTDEVYGGKGNDDITGYSAVRIYGEDGNDSLDVGPQTTLLSGGAGDDWLYAENCCGDSSETTIQGGARDDRIYAADGYPDVIDCGGGKRDWVEFDRGGVDTVTKCEKKHAR